MFSMAIEDCKVLSYGDIVLQESDLQLLQPGGWLNDRLLSFAAEFISKESRTSMSGSVQFEIVSPPVVELIKSFDDDDAIASFLADLNLNEKEIVMFMLNDNEDPALANGGSHWTLVVFDRSQDMFFHFNSAPNSSLSSFFAQAVADKVSRAVGTSSATVKEVRCPCQRNGSDCGIFVMEFAKCIAESNSLAAVDGLRSPEISAKRCEWFNRIVSLSDRAVK